MQKTYSITRRADADLGFEGGAQTCIALHRVITEENSDEMGGGYMRINGIETVATLPNDELAVCLEGSLRLTWNGQDDELAPGDFAFIPKGADVTFAGTDAVVFWAAHPVDWRTRKS